MEYYYLSELAESWGMTEQQLLRLGAEGKLTLHHEPRRMAGSTGGTEHHMFVLEKQKILDILASDETSIRTTYIGKDRDISTTEYSHRGKPLGDLVINKGDIVVKKSERERYENEALPSWQPLDTKGKTEITKLACDIANSLRRIPEREELTRELIRRFGRSHDIKASRYTGESFSFDGKPYNHDTVNKIIKRLREMQDK